jgi:hypothetical protein
MSEKPDEDFASSPGCGCLLMLIVAAWLYVYPKPMGQPGWVLSCIFGIVLVVLASLGDKVLRWLMK